MFESLIRVTLAFCYTNGDLLVSHLVTHEITRVRRNSWFPQ